MGMNKNLIFSTQTEKGVFLYHLDPSNDVGNLEKTASAGEFHPEIANYITSCKEIPGQIQVLLTALGAGEFWGANVNGDFFPENSLKHEGSDFGYKTFETMAHVYKHHINKDPNKSYGRVILSVWNERMKRVELIVTLEEAKAPDLVEKINNGEYPEVSMGAKVPYDVCSICSNKAKTRKEYCEHLRYHMNKIPPGHSKVAYAVNTIPKFFDISFVLIGADRIAKVMKKIAGAAVGSLEVKLASENLVGIRETFEKQASMGLDKKAEIIKNIPSNLDGNTVGRIRSLAAKGPEVLHPFEKEIPSKVLTRMTDHISGREGLNRILSTLLYMGMVPKPQEFQNIALRSLGKTDLAEEYERLGLVFDTEGKVEDHQAQACEDIVDISPKNIDSTIISISAPFLEGRSYSRPLLLNRVNSLLKLAEAGKLNYSNIETIKLATEDESSKLGLLPMMAALTGIYMAMKKHLPVEEASGMSKVLLKHPTLISALGIGGVMASKSIFGRSIKGKYDFNPDNEQVTMGTFQEEIAYKNNNPITKTGSVATSFLKRTLIGVPALYMASGILDVKRARNPYEQEGAISAFIRKNPDVAGAALAGEALMGLPVTKGVGNALKSGFKFINKIGSVQEDAISTALYSLAMPGTSLPLRIASFAIDDVIMKGVGKLWNIKNGNKQKGGTDGKY